MSIFNMLMFRSEVNVFRYLLRKKLYKIMLITITMLVARAIPAAPRSFAKIMFNAIFKEMQIALMISGVLVFLKE